MKRFTVSIHEEDYTALKALAEDRRPPLTLQYLVRYAVRRLLEDADDPQFRLALGDPVNGRDQVR